MPHGTAKSSTYQKLIWTYLALICCFLFVRKFSQQAVPQDLFSVAINLFLLSSSLLAAWACVRAVLLLRTGGQNRGYWKILAASMVMMFVAEFEELFHSLVYSSDDTRLGLSSIFWLLGRVGVLVAFLLVIIKTPRDSLPDKLRTLVFGTAYLVIAAFTVYWVIIPLFRDQSSVLGAAVPIVLVVVDLIVLGVSVAALSTSSIFNPKSTSWFFLPVLGMTFYFIVDILYYYFFAINDPDFCLLEIGYVAGYALVAIGAIRDTEAKASL